MRILFMGTPDFAKTCLQKLLNSKHEICAVYTQPDKPVGRKQKLTPSPVKVLAQEAGIPVLQPTTLKTEEAAEQFRSFHPDIAVVVAYGKLLPKKVLEIPPQGCINVHASLLPKYRGAAPIQWSVLNGDKITGVTTMFMAEGLDTGDMLLKAETSIGQNETSGELGNRLAELGADLLLQTIEELPNIIPQPQGEMTTAYASMLDKTMSPIDWNKDALEIHHQICGLNPWPTASTVFEGIPLKIWKSKVIEKRNGKPGQILKDFVVCCGNGTAIQLLEVQAAGKKRMNASDFLRGHLISTGTVLPF